MHDSGGVLDMSLSEVDMDGKFGEEDKHLSPGRYLLLAIADTGHGISPEIIERIFDPYFTTKEKDVGTGLGLSVVQRIVKKHGGNVRVFSEPGKGTTFHVLIPVLEGGETVPVETRLDIPKGTGRILFVDDEAPITDIGMRMLRRQGYDVEMKTSSLEALECFNARPYDFDLLITDMTMPHVRGDALARAVMAIRPEMPVIVCTGHSDMIDDEKAGEMGIRAVLKKPVGMSEMARAVYDILFGENRASI
jgi:CheY-like chemotaxis protein